MSFTWKVQFHELIRFEMHFATFSKVKWPMTQVIARRYLSLMDIKKYIMVSKNHIFSVQHIRYMSKLSIAKSTIITWGSFFYCKLKQHVIEYIFNVYVIGKLLFQTVEKLFTYMGKNVYKSTSLLQIWRNIVHWVIEQTFKLHLLLVALK